MKSLPKSPTPLTALKFLKKSWPEIILFPLFFIFSCWLMWHTFGYRNSEIYIAPKAWSDFSATLPLIRSFSWGNNFPPQDPLFAGEPMHYHYLFFLVVGQLEKAGIPLDFALNIPSALGFFGLTIMIYLLAKLIFKNRFVPVLSVIFFLFNGTFSFLEFFKQYPLSWHTPQEIVSNLHFPSFGPYDGKTVSAFWNLNIYTNQRHLALAYATVLFFYFLIVRAEILKKGINFFKAALLGLLVGFLPFLHSVGYVIAMATLGGLFLLFPRQRKPLFILLGTASLIGFPQLFLMKIGGGQGSFRFHPGYLISHQLTFSNFINYWFYNLGLGFLLIPLGFIVSRARAKKILISFLPLFLIGNLFQFSREMAANHKFFNLFIITANIYSAAAVYFIWQKKILGKIISLFLIIALIFSGVIDFFPIYNDHLGPMADAPKNQEVAWIKNNTKPEAIFLNSSYTYHPASIAGRKIFLGWPYFPWAGGLDVDSHSKIMKEIYENKDPIRICQLLIENKIGYFTVEDVFNDPNLPAIDSQFFLDNFTYSFSSPNRKFYIFETNKSCQGHFRNYDLR